jgi:cation transport ATPase
VEAGSEHPLASAILLAARERRLAFPGGDVFVATAGGGAEAIVEGRTVLVGSARFLAERNLLVNASALLFRRDALLAALVARRRFVRRLVCAAGIARLPASNQMLYDEKPPSIGSTMPVTKLEADERR